MSKPLRVYFVVGEASGDALGADLIDHLRALAGDVEALGLGGTKMQERGLEPLFDVSQIAIMGLSGVVKKLPSLLARARQVAVDILEKDPDVVLLIDSPEFAKVVAKRTKAKRPDLPVVKYVCPTVWSWRPGRAAKMNSYVDHVLAILPFEPEVMRDLGGPETTYVGHPLARLAGTIDFKKKRKPKNPPNILLLPGSRNSEASRLMPILRETIAILEERGQSGNYLLPAVPHLRSMIEKEIATWDVKPELLDEEQAKLEAMQTGDVAIAASGTAILELAMYGVPTISIYKLDPAINALRFMMKAWTAALPNLIADKVIVPERINEFARPGYIARLAEDLLIESSQRAAQIEGFKLVHDKMQQEKPPGQKCAEVVLRLATGKSSPG